MKIVVEAPMSPFSGYGNDGIGMVTALMAQGHDVYLHPTVVQAPLPPEVAALLAKPLQSPFDLAIHHVDPGQLGHKDVEQFGASEVNVGWTMWEYTTLDNLYRRSYWYSKTRRYDAILGYDQVTVDALRPRTSPKVALPVLQGGYWPEQWPAVQRDWHGERFGFCMAGMLHERKEPFAAIEAFKALKDEKGDEFEGAELHLKTQIPGLHPAMESWVPKLRIHYASWPKRTLEAFYGKQHCLLAPSRGEGKNMPALEFLSTGGTVIATNWGGHTQWLDEAYAYPIDYRLVPVQGDKYPDCMNARIDPEHLKQLMWHVYTHRDEAKQKGYNGSQMIPRVSGWSEVMERFFLRLKDALGDKGRTLYEKHVMTKAEHERQLGDREMAITLSERLVK